MPRGCSHVPYCQGSYSCLGVVPMSLAAKEIIHVSGLFPFALLSRELFMSRGCSHVPCCQGSCSCIGIVPMCLAAKVWLSPLSQSQYAHSSVSSFQMCVCLFLALNNESQSKPSMSVRPPWFRCLKVFFSPFSPTCRSDIWADMVADRGFFSVL